MRTKKVSEYKPRYPYSPDLLAFAGDDDGFNRLLDEFEFKGTIAPPSAVPVETNDEPILIDWFDDDYEFDGYPDCACCTCCGHSDACLDREFEAARKQWTLRIKVRSLLGKLSRR